MLLIININKFAILFFQSNPHRVKSMEKHILSILIVTLFGITIFMVSHFFAINISPFILFSSIVMVSIYVILSFEIIHRTSIAIFGALVLVIASLLDRSYSS